MKVRFFLSSATTSRVSMTFVCQFHLNLTPSYDFFFSDIHGFRQMTDLGRVGSLADSKELKKERGIVLDLRVRLVGDDGGFAIICAKIRQNSGNRYTVLYTYR